MTVEHTSAPEVAEIAEKLIRQYHPHLEEIGIEYVFRSKAAGKGGKVVLGNARLIRGLPAFLARDSEEPFFLLEIALDTWKTLKDNQKEALVDHELCHFGIGEDEKKVIIPHDLEEFTAVVERHGLWSPDTKEMAAVLKED